MSDEENHDERSADSVSQAGIERHMFGTLTLQECPTGRLVISPAASDAVVDVSLVLPTYNEGKNIVAVVDQLMAVLESVEGMEYEVIVVDDDSPGSHVGNRAGTDRKVSAVARRAAAG